MNGDVFIGEEPDWAASLNRRISAGPHLGLIEPLAAATLATDAKRLIKPRPILEAGRNDDVTDKWRECKKQVKSRGRAFRPQKQHFEAQSQQVSPVVCAARQG